MSQAKKSLLLLASIVLLHFPTLSAQQDPQQQARVLWAIGNQMGAVHYAAFYNDLDGTRKGLQNIVLLIRSSQCFGLDPGPWEKLLSKLNAGTSPRSLFLDVCALEGPPMITNELQVAGALDPGSFGIATLSCQCQKRTEPHTPSGQCTIQYLDWNGARQSAGLGEGRDMYYLGWDGARWLARLDRAGGVLIHAPNGDFNASHPDDYMKYRNWSNQNMTSPKLPECGVIRR